MENIYGAVKLPMCETDLILVENILTIALTQYAIMHTQPTGLLGFSCIKQLHTSNGHDVTMSHQLAHHSNITFYEKERTVSVVF